MDPSAAVTSSTPPSADRAPARASDPRCEQLPVTSESIFAAARDRAPKLFVGKKRLPAEPEPTSRLIQRLEESAQLWADAWNRSCELESGVTKESLEPHRRACLDRVRSMQSHTIELLVNDPGADIRHVHEALDHINGLLAICNSDILVRHEPDPMTFSDPERTRDAMQESARAEIHARVRPFEPARAAPTIAPPHGATTPIHGARLTLTAHLRRADRALRAGRYVDAQDLAKQAFTVAENAGDELGQGLAQEVIGLAQFRLARYEEADRSWKFTQEVFQNHLGLDHPITAYSLINFSLLDNKRGDNEAALEKLERAETIMRDDSDDYALLASTILLNRGKVFLEQGKLRSAIEVLHRARETQERLLGFNHPDNGMVYANLGASYMTLENIPESLKWSEQCIELLERKHGTNHHFAAIALLNAGMARSRLGEIDRAVPMLYRAIEIFEESVGKTHDQTGNAYVALGMILVEAGRHAEAGEWLDKADEAIIAAVGETHSQRANVLRIKGQLAAKQGRLKAAQRLAEQARALVEMHHGDQHSFNLGIYQLLADVHLGRGNARKGLEWAQRTLELSRATVGADHPQAAQAQVNIARAHLLRRSFPAAKRWFLRALATFERAGHDNHPLARFARDQLRRLQGH